MALEKRICISYLTGHSTALLKSHMLSLQVFNNSVSHEGLFLCNSINRAKEHGPFSRGWRGGGGGNDTDNKG